YRLIRRSSPLPPLIVSVVPAGVATPVLVRLMSRPRIFGALAVLSAITPPSAHVQAHADGHGQGQQGRTPGQHESHECGTSIATGRAEWDPLGLSLGERGSTIERRARDHHIPAVVLHGLEPLDYDVRAGDQLVALFEHGPEALLDVLPGRMRLEGGPAAEARLPHRGHRHGQE